MAAPQPSVKSVPSPMPSAVAQRPLPDLSLELPSRRKEKTKAPKPHLRILIASDPSRPMRSISLPRALPLVASVVAVVLLLATVALTFGSWKISDARAALERRVRAMVAAADSVALGSGGLEAGMLGFGHTAPLADGAQVALPGGPWGSFVLHSVNNNEEMEVRLNLQTGELEPESYRRLRHQFRCQHTTAEAPIDPRLIDLLYRIAQRTKQKVLLVSGFRAPMYSKAKLSYHTRGMAADIRIPGMTAMMARDLAESMGVKGLGYYPVSQFIHVDVRDDRTRWIDYGANSKDGEGTEHGGGHHETHDTSEPGEDSGPEALELSDNGP